MEDLVKSYEEREVSHASRDNYRAPHHASDPRFPACACLQFSGKSQVSKMYLLLIMSTPVSIPCLSHSEPPYT